MSSQIPSTKTDKEDNRHVLIFTDGACSGNPGPGGWGAVLRYRDKERHISGWSSHTTNNRMELLAAISALETLKRPCRVILTTDSQYLKQGITTWLSQWKKRNWLTTSRKPVKNKDLWMALDRLCVQHSIQWQWVKGHNEHPENELADELARKGIKDGQKGLIEEDLEGNLIS